MDRPWGDYSRHCNHQMRGLQESPFSFPPPIMSPFVIIITILVIAVILPAWPSWQIYVSVWEGRGVFYICRWDHRRMSSSHKLAPKFATILSHTGHIRRVQADTVCYREIAVCNLQQNFLVGCIEPRKLPWAQAVVDCIFSQRYL